MKILIFTDNHFAQYSSIVRGRGKKYSVRLHNQIDSLNWISDLAKQKACDLIVCAGDFFDKSELNAEELTALQEVKWSDIPYYFLVGNHEMGLNNLSFSSAHLLKMIPKAMVIDEPYIESGFGFRLLFLPYMLESNKLSIRDCFKQASFDMWETQEVKKNIIISHNDIAGIRYGQFESKSGYSIDEIESSCDLFINGHLHNQHQVTDKIINIGNLTGQNFSEDAEKYSHCAVILDTDTLKVDLINNPYALNFYKFDIFSKDAFNELNKCKDRSVISIKTYQSLLDELKVVVSQNEKIVNHRFVTLPEFSKIDVETKQDFNKLDHISQFKNYISCNIEPSDILKEELSLIN